MSLICLSVLAPSQIAQLPHVTAFLAAQPEGSAFRVSVHSWELPQPSNHLQFAVEHGKQAYFEARVFIDGLCVAWVLSADGYNSLGD